MAMEIMMASKHDCTTEHSVHCLGCYIMAAGVMVARPLNGYSDIIDVEFSDGSVSTAIHDPEHGWRTDPGVHSPDVATQTGMYDR